MAKVSFNSLITVKTVEDVTIDINGKKISVKQYLPIKAKTEMLDTIIQSSFDDKGIFSPLRYKIYYLFGLIQYYTNINITDTMLKDIEKTYDLFILNNIEQAVLAAIPESEKQVIEIMSTDAITAIINYSNSFAGQIAVVARDYKNTNFDLEKISQTLSDPSQIGFLKELMTKMG